MKKVITEYICVRKTDKNSFKTVCCNNKIIDICNGCINDFITFILINNLYIPRSECKDCKGRGYDEWTNNDCNTCLKFKLMIGIK